MLHIPHSQVGDSIPKDIAFFALSPEGMPTPVNSGEFFAGKKVALFAVPGAFTPGCSQTHCPSFVLGHAKLTAAGFDAVACTSVNDPFVMDAWCKSQNGEGKLTMLADGNCDFANAIGMACDKSAGGMGTRSKRYGALVVDGVLKYMGVDEVKGVISGSLTCLSTRSPTCPSTCCPWTSPS